MVDTMFKGENNAKENRKEVMKTDVLKRLLIFFK